MTRDKSTPHLLVVDDDVQSRTMLLRVLGAEGYLVDAAEDGPTALELAVARRYDAVVTDLKMPVMDGIELLRKLHEHDPELPVVVATGLAEVTSAVAAMRAGAEDYIAKPIQLESLRLVIERALDRRKTCLEAETLRRE
jgi:DNA-binding NtrC family response regulator